MKIHFLQDCLYQGRQYAAGQVEELSNAEIAELIEGLPPDAFVIEQDSQLASKPKRK